MRDPVVAGHYRDVDPATMRAETLTSDRLVYVSYRVDDRVYWTKRKLLIRNGETILTNGQVEVRSRCGNCISLAPMLPTSDDEPDESQFDALTDEPLLVAWGWGPSGSPLGVSAPPGDPDDMPVGGPPLVPVFTFGGGSFPGEPITNVPNNSPPGTLPLGGVADSPPPGTSTPPGGTNPPVVVGTPDNRVVGTPDNKVVGTPDNKVVGTPDNKAAVGDSSTLEPFVLQALRSNGSAPPASPTVTSQAAPVPEPGTLLLFGSGIAGLLARRYRAKNTY